MPKITDNGKNQVVVDFGKAGKLTVDVDAYPDTVQQYGKLRGFRKIFSDEGAGFKGTEKELFDKCKKRHAALMKGDFRSGGERGTTVDQLAAAFKKLAPEATDEAINARVKATHPDFAKDEKAKKKAAREVASIMKTIRALDALK